MKIIWKEITEEISVGEVVKCQYDVFAAANIDAAGEYLGTYFEDNDDDEMWSLIAEYEREGYQLMPSIWKEAE